MKPKDLKAAFSWGERRPLLEGRIFHVPNYYENYGSFSLPSWEDKELFGNANPVCIEYCAGNGGWITERAKRFPDLNWIAVEKRYDRVRKIWSKINNENLSNLIVVCGEAWLFTHHYVPAHSIEEAFINFPDPWPKGKHEKHRLMKSRFLDELSRILKPGKKVTFASDDPDYVAATQEVFAAHSGFQCHPILTDFPDYGISWFESLWRKKGKNIHYLQFSNLSQKSALDELYEIVDEPRKAKRDREEDIEHLNDLRWRSGKGDVRECRKGAEAVRNAGEDTIGDHIADERSYEGRDKIMQGNSDDFGDRFIWN